ncbi:unnamed protein product [Brugia timori]|uniref:FLYWCH-type domain-containing protein n=1 Tax=Brugia timori TaxID=42155 RepID=A0A0R3QSI0_9BILA|nr:unnamed protein product [Brugia timori]
MKRNHNQGNRLGKQKTLLSFVKSLCNLTTRTEDSSTGWYICQRRCPKASSERKETFRRARLILIFSTNTDHESVAYRSF